MTPSERERAFMGDWSKHKRERLTSVRPKCSRPVCEEPSEPGQGFCTGCIAEGCEAERPQCDDVYPDGLDYR